MNLILSTKKMTVTITWKLHLEEPMPKKLSISKKMYYLINQSLSLRSACRMFGNILNLIMSSTARLRLIWTLSHNIAQLQVPRGNHKAVID